ncbi:hypothetical protein [Kurthia massiliensis]|uniref:hypothetical protein n=1 Tax=Kurthia massiliensis TaxID=1033739 RepID=UPI00028967A5|nr:hypothetical protein [Kurthia massiliensis]
MNIRDISTEARFVLSAIALLIIGMLVTMFAPFIYSETKYFSEDAIVWIIPMTNFWLLGLAFIIVIVMLLLLAWRRNMWTYMMSVLLIGAALFVGYLSFLSVTFIRETGIEQRDVLTTHAYTWQEIDHVVLTYDERNQEMYTFTPKKGEPFTLAQNAKTASAGLQSLLSENDVPFEERAE